MHDERFAPPDIFALAVERTAARRNREFDRADELKEAIEAAGWKVVDSGSHFTLSPLVRPTVEVDGIPRYGGAAAVPSVLDDPAIHAFTVVIVAEDIEVDALLAGLRSHAPAGTQVVVVANEPAPSVAAGLAAGTPAVAPVGSLAPEITWTNRRLGAAAARNVGLRRAAGAVVVFADPAVSITGDPLSPLAAALADHGVAVAGAAGLRTATGDLRDLAPAPGPDVHVIEGSWLAARRDDLVAIGEPTPIDEHFAAPDHLDDWLSLALRVGEEPGDAPRRAVALGLPVSVVRADDAAAGAAGSRPDRAAKRNFYRLLDSFRGRGDLLTD